MKKFFLFSYLILILLFFPKLAFAEEKGIGVYPPIIKINATAPSNISLPITLKNLGDMPIEAQASIRSFGINQTGKINLILYKDYTKEMLSIIDNIKLQEKDQTISKLVFSPNEIKKLNLKIDINKEVQNKDFYLSILFLINTQDSSDNTRSLISIGAGTNVLLAIGNSKESYQESFVSPLLTSEGNLKFNISLANTGEHFITIKPQVRITNIFGKVIEDIDLKEENVLPGETKTLSNTKIQNSILSQEKYYFGPYKAILSLDIAGRKTISDKSIIIFVLPGGTIWFLTGGIMLTILIIQRIRTRRRKNS